jgi:hypothetical protein
VITLCIIYLPEGAPVTQCSLAALVRQLPRPFLIVGDFNAHDSFWRSSRAQSNRRGRVLANFIDDFNLILLNKGERTRFNSFNGEFSSIDLSICSSSLATKLTMSVHQDLCGSDHFLILINKNDRLPRFFNGKERWNIHKADRAHFESALHLILTPK